MLSTAQLLGKSSLIVIDISKWVCTTLSVFFNAVSLTVLLQAGLHPAQHIIQRAWKKMIAQNPPVIHQPNPNPKLNPKNHTNTKKQQFLNLWIFAAHRCTESYTQLAIVII